MDTQEYLSFLLLSWIGQLDTEIILSWIMLFHEKNPWCPRKHTETHWVFHAAPTLSVASLGLSTAARKQAGRRCWSQKWCQVTDRRKLSGKLTWKWKITLFFEETKREASYFYGGFCQVSWPVGNHSYGTAMLIGRRSCWQQRFWPYGPAGPSELTRQERQQATEPGRGELGSEIHGDANPSPGTSLGAGISLGCKFSLWSNTLILIVTS